jgi:hypothetical protein
VDAWLLVNNSNGTLEHIADGEKNLVPNIENKYLWKRIHGNAIQKYQ